MCWQVIEPRNDGDHQDLHRGGPVGGGEFVTGPETEAVSPGETETGEAVPHLGGWTRPLQHRGEAQERGRQDSEGSQL